MAEPGGTHRSANDAKRAERQVRAYELSLRGHSYRKISEIMKAEGYRQVSHVTVRTLIKLECDARVLPLADEWRKRTIDRLQIAINKLMEQIENPKNSGQLARNSEVLGKLEERLSKMLGADAPMQTQVQVTETTQSDLAMQDLMSEIQARQSLEEAQLAESVEPVPGVKVDSDA